MLLDTCILIDVLRGRAEAENFVTSLPSKPAISVVTATEIIAGCKNSRERRHIDRLLASYALIDVDVETATCAGAYVQKFGKSHGTDVIDAIIAATASVRGITLATQNLKHFPMFPDLDRPY